MKSLSELLDMSRRALDCARCDGLSKDVDLICEAVMDELKQYMDSMGVE